MKLPGITSVLRQIPFAGKKIPWGASRVELSKKPLISVITPVRNTEERWLIKAIESVRKQSYPHWELCIADDCSDRDETRSLLGRADITGDKRIKITMLESHGGIVAATNAALKLAKGDYVTFLDHDDEFSPDALMEIAKAAASGPGVSIIYSDEDKITQAGRRVSPFLKPDWSHELLLSCNYMTHLIAYDKRLVDSLGGLREGYDGSQDYDLILRAVERAQKIVHIPKILYHWRMIEGSAALSTSAKEYAYSAARRAIEDAIGRLSIEGEVLYGRWRGSYRVRRAIREDAEVSVIIAGGGEDAQKTIKSIHRTGSKEKGIISETIVASELESGSVPKALNRASNEARGNYLLFLAAGLQVKGEEGILPLIEHAQREEVGAVGGKVTTKGKRLAHGGIAVGRSRGKIAEYLHFGVHAGSPGSWGELHVTRNCSAVSWMSMMIRRDLFRMIGGFDDERLKGSFYDIDLCFRLRQRGLFCVFTPFARFDTETGIKPAISGTKNEVGTMKERWGRMLRKDPYFRFR